MAYIYAWPPSLPQRGLMAGFGESRGANIRRTEMDKGPPKTRFRAKRADPISVTYVMDETQFAAFETFVFDTLANGVYRFGWPHARTGALTEVRLVSTPEGQLFRLGAQTATSYEVALTIEVMP